MDSNNKIHRLNRILLFSLFLSAHSLQLTTSHAQTWDEWFRQKKTQKKYLIEQIAALKIHVDNVRTGFDIAHKGWTTLYNIKNGDMNLHRDFFNSLKQVNPHIANSAKVADIIAFQLHVIQSLKNLTDFCKNNSQFTPEEITYVTKVYAHMLIISDANITELLSILRANRSEMTDDERLARLDHLHAEMLDKKNFALAFSSETRWLAEARSQDQKSIRITSQLY